MYTHRIIAKKFHRRIRPERFNHQKEVARWYADGGDVKFRYTYPLNKKSVVIDAGGYEGEWAQGIYDKYLCNIYVFEPINKYYKDIVKRFSAFDRVKIFHAGLSGKDREEKMSVEDVTSSVFKKGKKTETVKLLDIKDFCEKSGIRKIDLVKINIEGGEYELLERIIDSGMVKDIKYIQVQFHNFFPNAEKRMEKIQRKLSKTHRPTYQYWFVWDNWVKK